MTISKLYRLVQEMLNKLRDDYVSVFSAQAAFFIILSFFPFTMFLLTLVQYLPIPESDIMERFSDIMPQAIHSYIILIINEVYDRGSGTLISITAITALWSASKGFLGLVRGLNSVYNIEETRGYIRLRIISAFYTLIFTILLIITLVFLVFGNSLYLWIQAKYPAMRDLALLILSIRAIVTLTILSLFFLLMFIAIPNRKTKVLSELPGAILAAAGWLGFSYLYSFYIDNMSGFSSTYGSLTAIVLLMLWVYFCMYILFIGAEFNDFLKEKNWLHRISKTGTKEGQL